MTSLLVEFFKLWGVCSILVMIFLLIVHLRICFVEQREEAEQRLRRDAEDGSNLT